VFKNFSHNNFRHNNTHRSVFELLQLRQETAVEVEWPALRCHEPGLRASPRGYTARRLADGPRTGLCSLLCRPVKSYQPRENRE
jgi:hypothetical protein